MRVSTVYVDRGGAKVLINESDYDPSRDTLWGESSPAVSGGAGLDDDITQDDVNDEKDELIESLADYGIEKDRRSSIKSLRDALAKAET